MEKLQDMHLVYACVTCSELPSNISTMMLTGVSKKFVMGTVNLTSHDQMTGKSSVDGNYVSLPITELIHVLYVQEVLLHFIWTMIDYFCSKVYYRGDNQFRGDMPILLYVLAILSHIM